MLTNKLVFHMTVVISLAAFGIVAMVLGQETIAATCSGAIAGYVIKNGFRLGEEKQNGPG